MAVRAPSLIRTDDSVPGVVSFYDRRQENAQAAFIAQIDVRVIAPDLDPTNPAMRAAVHGYTQNVLDSSNSLSGDARVAYIKTSCDRIMAGGWASVPVDAAAQREKAIVAMMKLPGWTRAMAERAVDAPPAE